MKKGILLTVFFLLIFSALTFGEDQDIVKIQGVVMSLDLKKSMLVVNERTFVWDQNTTFYNEKGSPITIDKLRTKGWVYIEGENDKVNKRWVAKKIYLLPKYIDRKERQLYPFIQQD
jgi:hypothetical protein